MDLTDKQWEILAPLAPESSRREDNRGRPRADDRKPLGGMLWVLRTGAQWQDLPGRYGTKPTWHRRFQRWVDAGVFEQILRTLVENLKERGGLSLSECFVDATFAPAKRGPDEQLRSEGIETIAPNRAKRRKTQDGRAVRRHRRRWKVERLVARLHNFRRIVTRREVKVQNYVGFAHLGCIRILLRQPALIL